MDQFQNLLKRNFGDTDIELRAELLFKLWDTDKDGKVSLEEYNAGMTSAHRQESIWYANFQRLAHFMGLDCSQFVVSGRAWEKVFEAYPSEGWVVTCKKNGSDVSIAAGNKKQNPPMWLVVVCEP
jgi:hypothetical protein